MPNVECYGIHASALDYVWNTYWDFNRGVWGCLNHLNARLIFYRWRRLQYSENKFKIACSLITEFKSSFVAFWAKWILQKRKDVWLLNIVGTIWKYLGWNIHGKSHNSGTGFCFINMAKSDWVILNTLMQSNVSHTLKAFASCWHWHYTTSFLWITTTSVSEHIYRKDEKTS